MSFNSLTMKTTILEELNLPEERAEALKREAVRKGVPVAVLIRERLLDTSERIVSAASVLTTPVKRASVAA